MEIYYNGRIFKHFYCIFSLTINYYNILVSFFNLLSLLDIIGRGKHILLCGLHCLQLVLVKLGHTKLG